MLWNLINDEPKTDGFLIIYNTSNELVNNLIWSEMLSTAIETWT